MRVVLSDGTPLGRPSIFDWFAKLSEHALGHPYAFAARGGDNFTMGLNRTHLSVQQRVAISHQYGDDHYYFSDGLSYVEQPESG